MNRFVFVRSGEAQISIPEHPPYELATHCFVFLPFAQPFDIQVVADTELVIMSVVGMSSSVSESGSGSFRGGYEELTVLLDMCSYKASPLLLDFFETIADYARLGISSIEMCQIKKQELFVLLQKSYSPQELAGIFYPFLAETTDFKRKAIGYAQRTTTVSDLARCMGMERGHFHRVFKKHFGLPPYQWMLQQKAEQTLVLLHKKHLPLKRIIEYLGFSSQSHLNKFCKARFGKTAKSIQDEL